MEGPYKIALNDDAPPFAINFPRGVALPLMDKTERAEKDGRCRCNRESRRTYRLVCTHDRRPKERWRKDLCRLNEAERKCASWATRNAFCRIYPGTVIRRKNILKVRCELWLLASSVGRWICLTDNLHHTLWKILFQAIALRHFISAGTLPEKDVCDPGGNWWSVMQMDDILVFGATQSQHDERIYEVLRRLQKNNVTLNSNKCHFSVQEVKFLDQTINESRISLDQDKIKAIIDIPETTHVSGIRRFLGIINHLWKITPHLVEITKPMCDLLSKTNDWTWDTHSKCVLCSWNTVWRQPRYLFCTMQTERQHSLQMHPHTA